jgi:LPS sulfotransferase NodH
MKVFGELFRGGTDNSTKESILNSTENYFQNQIFRSYDRSIKAVGFKIFYHHPVYDHDGKVWSYLLDMDDLKVIHLRRSNILRSLVSKRIARQSDVWKEEHKPREAQLKKVELSIEECQTGFDQTQRWAADADEKFRNNPLLQLTYEELTSDFHGKMQRIQEFLGVMPVDLQPLTVKQNPEALDKLIINYEELKQHFSGTQWEVFFSE